MTYSATKKTRLLSRLQSYENRLLRKGFAVLGTAALLMSGGEVLAQQPVRVGEEFRVNTFTEDQQFSVSMSMDDDGNFVIVWLSKEQYEGYYDGIYGQRYNKYGEKLGSEFKINSDTLLNYKEEVYPSVAMDNEGNFVAVWADYINEDGKYFHLYGQRFNNEGTTVDEKFQISTDPIRNIESISVAMDDDGDFAVVWNHALSYSSTFSTITGQLYDKVGDRVGTEFEVTSENFLGFYNINSNIAMDSEGDFAVTWVAYIGGELAYTSVYANTYHKDGTIKRKIEVTENIVGAQATPSIDMNDDGDFIIAWVNASIGDDSVNIYGRKFNSEGGAIIEEFKVNTFIGGYEGFPKVTMDNRGDFIITWDGEDEDETSDYSIYAQLYNNEAIPKGNEFIINNNNIGEQRLPSIKMNNQDSFIVIWNGEGEDRDSDIFGQLFSLGTVSTTNQYIEGKEYIVSPNPVQNQLQVQIQSEFTHSAELKILSLDGKVLLEQRQSLFKGQNELNLNVERLAAGTYFLQLLTQEDVEQIKFVKL